MFSSFEDLQKMCKGMVDSKLSETFPNIFRLIYIVLTFPISSATTERAFSALKIIKTRLRTKIADQWLIKLLVAYIERGKRDNH